MPVTDPLQGATFLPAWSDPYQIPQTIQDMYQFLLARGIPRFTTTAERDAAFPSPVPGQMAFAAGALYMYSTSVASWRIMWRPDMPAQAEVSLGSSQIITSASFAGLPTPVSTSLVLPGPAVVRLELAAVFGNGGGSASDVILAGIAASGAGITLAPDALTDCLRSSNSATLPSGTYSRTVTTTIAGTLAASVQARRDGAAALIRGIRLTLTPLRWA